MHVARSEKIATDAVLFARSSRLTTTKVDLELNILLLSACISGGIKGKEPLLHVSIMIYTFRT